MGQDGRSRAGAVARCVPFKLIGGEYLDMTAATGRPRGRPPGVKNKTSPKSKAAFARIARKIERAVDGAFTGDAHAFLMTVYKDPAHQVDLRLDAAKAAIR